MPNTIVHKKSSTPGAAPSAGSLTAGELAINTADGVVYLKKEDGTVVPSGASRSHTHNATEITYVIGTGQGAENRPLPQELSRLQSLIDDTAASSHAHGNLTTDGKIGTVSGKAIVTGEAGVLQASDYVANALFLYDTTDDNGAMFAIQDTDPYWSPTAIEAGTPGKFRVSIGAAAVSHAHTATDITSGTLDAARLPKIPKFWWL